MAEMLAAMLENLIYDITGSAIKKWLDRFRLNSFLKALRKDVSKFCKENECMYINSSAFDYFIRSTDFLKRAIKSFSEMRLKEQER